jgi:hypothetical protein
MPTPIYDSPITFFGSGGEITDAQRALNVEGDGLIWPDSSFGLWEAATNLLTNGGFESNTTGWGSSGAATITRDTSVSKFGAASCRVDVTAAAGVRTTGTTVTAGNTYAFSVWVLGTLGRSINVQLLRQDLATVLAAKTIIASGGWQRVSLTATAPVTETVYALTQTVAGVTDSFWIDGAQLEARATGQTLTLAGTEIMDTTRALGVQGDGRDYVQVTNLVTNGGCETNASGWGYGVRSTAFAKFGTASLKAAAMNFVTDHAEWGNTTPLTVGAAYTLSIWAFQNSGSTQTARLQLVSTGSSGGFIGPTTTVPSGIWTRITATGVVPSDALTYGRLRFKPLSGTLDWYLDGTQIERGLVAHDYVETNGAQATAAQREQYANLLPNPSFETDISAWNDLTAGATFARVTTESKFGVASAHLTYGGGATFRGRYHDTTQAVPTGATVTVSLWMKGTGTVTLRLGGAIPNPLVDCVLTPTWTRYTLTGTATSTGSARVELSSGFGAYAFDGYVDGVMVEYGTVAHDYTDTSAYISTDNSSTGIWEATTNLIPNGGAESGITFTGSTNGATVTQDTQASKFGTASFRVVTPGVATNEGIHWLPTANTRIAVTAGATYVFSAWLWGSGTVRLVFDEYTGVNGSLIRTTNGSAITLTATPTRYSFTLTIGGSALTPRVTTQGAQAITFWADGAQLEQRILPLASATVAGNEITDAVRLTGTSGDGLAAPDSSYGIWEARTNLCTNGGLETNTNGWSAYASGSSPVPTIARDTSQKKFGTASLRVDTQGANQFEGVISSLITVTPSTMYSHSAWFYSAAGGTFRIGMDWKGVGGVFLGSVSGTQITIPAATWTRLFVSGISHARAISVTLTLYAQNNAPTATTYYVDGIQLEAAGTSQSLTLSGNEITDASRALAVRGDGRGYEFVFNHILYGNFETWASGAPTGWTVGASVTVSQQTTSPKFGSNYLRLSVASGAGNAGPTRIATTVGTLVQGVTYTASFWARRVSGTGLLNFAVDNVSGNVAQTSDTSGSWIRVTASFVLGTATSVALWPGTNGDVWEVDGFQIEAGAVAHDFVATNGTAVGAIQGPLVANLIPNGGFENGVLTEWQAQNAGTPSQQTSGAQTGTACAKVITTGAGAGEGMILRSAFSPVAKDGETYTFSVWLKGNAGGESVNLRLNETTLAGAFVRVDSSNAIVLTTSWVRYTFTVKLTGGATVAKISPLIVTSGTSAVTFFVDGAQLELNGVASTYVDTNGVVASSAVGAPDSTTGVWEASTNLLANGGFETNTTGWIAFGTGSIARVSNAGAKFGTSCLQVTTPGVASQEGMRNTVAQTINGSTAYTYSAWVKAPAGTTMRVHADEAALGGGFIKSDFTTFVATGDWQRISVPFLTDPNTNSIGLYVFVYGAVTAAATTFFVDGLQLEASTAPLTVTAAVTEITDATRAAGALLGTGASGQMLDGLLNDSSYGIRRAATNLFRRGQCDSTAGINLIGVGVTLAVDATTAALFSPQSVKVTCNGAAASQGAQPATVLGLGATAGVIGVGSVYFKGVAGQSYQAFLNWTNTDLSITSGAVTTFVATGAWQLVAPASLAVAALKTGDALSISVAINGTRAESFWIAHTMLETGQSIVAPYVATSGGTTATHAQGAPTAPSSLLDPTQGWVAMRVRMGWPSTNAPNILPRGFVWQDGPGTNFIRLLYNAGSNVWTIDRSNTGTSPASASVAHTFATGDYATLIAAWTGTQVKVSVNGGAFVTVANAAIPTGLPATVVIGDSTSSGGTRSLDGDVLWTATGTGALTDANAATIHGFGNTDPALTSLFPGTPTGLWRAVTPAIQTPASEIVKFTPYVETNGAAATRSAARVQATSPANLLASNIGWVAFRVRVPWDAAAPPSAFARLMAFSRANEVAPRDSIDVSYNAAAKQWLVDSWANGANVGSAASAAQSFAPGTTLTIVAYWTANTFGISVNGGNFVTGARAATAFSGALDTLDIGQTNSGAVLDADFLWVVLGGQGTPSNADAAAIHALGDTDPTFATLPSLAATQPQVIWTADVANYSKPGGGVPSPYIETNGSTAARAGGRVQIPSSVTSPTAGWCAFRIRPEFTPSTSYLNLPHTRTSPSSSLANHILVLGDASLQNLVDVMYREDSANLTTRITSGGASIGDAIVSAVGLTAGTPFTVVCYWKSNQWAISLNGGAFQVFNGTLPTFTPATLMDIGQQGGGSGFFGEILWAAFGSGTPAAGDATLLNSHGNTDPTPQSLSSLSVALGAIWSADSAAVEQPLGAATTFATPYVQTDGATAGRAAARVQGPAALMNGTQGWLAARVRMGFASGQDAWVGSATRLVMLHKGTQDTDGRIGMLLTNRQFNCYRSGADDPSFPAASSTVLDTFTTLSPNWAITDIWSDAITIAASGGRGVSASSSYGAAYWSAASFGAAQEAYCDIAGLPASGEILALFLRCQIGAAHQPGYYMTVDKTTGTWEVGALYDGSNSHATTVATRAVAVGDSVGFSAVGDVLTCWHKPSGGQWTSLGTASASGWGTQRITTGGYIGVEIPGAAGGSAIDNYGGGDRTVNIAGGRPFSATQTWNGGDVFTIIVSWTATTLGVSVNGGAFVTAANTKIPNQPTIFDIGSENGGLNFDGDFFWLAGGTGVLTDADAATIGLLPTADEPDLLTSFPPSAGAMFWTAEGSGYNTPTADGLFSTPYVHTNGSTATRPAARAQASPALLSAARGCVVARVRMGTPPAARASVAGAVAVLSDGTLNNRIGVYAGKNEWITRRVAAGVLGASPQLVDLYNLGDERTVVLSWDAVNLNVSIGGGSYQTAGNAGTFTPSVLDIGNQLGGNAWDGEVLWIALGAAPVASTDLFTLAAMSGAPVADDFALVLGPSYSFWSADTLAALSAYVSAAPYNLAAPTISGTPTVGYNLSANVGVWGGEAPISYSYDWQRSSDGVAWASLGSGGRSSYLLSATDYNYFFRVKVTASNHAGSTDAYSSGAA